MGNSTETMIHDNKVGDHARQYLELVDALADGNDTLAKKIAERDPLAAAYMVITEMMTDTLSDDDLAELGDILNDVPRVANMDLRPGVTPLICAVRHGQADAVRVLLTHPGVDVNACGPDGVTALMVACQTGRVDLIDQLSARSDLNVNAVSASGATALHGAAGMGHVAAAKRLLDLYGGALNLTGGDSGWSALDLARTTGRGDIVALLESWPSVAKPRNPGRG